MLQSMFASDGEGATARRNVAPAYQEARLQSGATPQPIGLCQASQLEARVTRWEGAAASSRSQPSSWDARASQLFSRAAALRASTDRALRQRLDT